MASSGGKSLCNHSLIHPPPKRTVLLKDYLRDDLSSCSSNGFKSFPRRQCCTTVGFFVEKDNIQLPRQRSTTIAALQRASGAVINVIKSLPLVQNRGNKAAKKGVSGVVLCRSLSRKVLSRRFWRKTTAREDDGSKGVPRRRRSFRELIMLDQEEHRKATSLNEDANNNAVFTSSGCGSDSWGDSEFTFASTGASSSETSNEHSEGTKEDALHHKIQEELVTKEYWSKEQFSPVSILDCPFEDEEDIYKSRFSSTSFSEAKQKHVHKRCHLEPVVLEKRFAQLELEDESHDNHSTKQSQNGNSIEGNARDLLNFVKRSIAPNSLVAKTENLLFDYFKQSIGENYRDIDCSKKLQLCKVAEDWIYGQPQELFLGWEVQKGRCAFIREMDKCGEWKNSDQEIQQLAMEMANEVFANLVDDFVLDLTTHVSH